MKDLHNRIAEVLDVEAVTDTDVLADFPEWDSLSVLSVIAMLDAHYGVNPTASELRNMKTVGEIIDYVRARTKM